MTLHQLYQKQVEAWKERFDIRGWINHGRDNWVMPDDLLLSRHKDTIELIEAEIERKKGMRKTTLNKELKADYMCGHSQTPEAEAHGYNSAIDEDIAYLEEQLKLIKKEQ